MTNRFARERVRHELRRRRLLVLRTETVALGMRRITLGGPEVEGFTSLGPADHVKLFFPTSTGEVVARDYTPLAYREDGPDGPELDIDFYLHGDSPVSGEGTSVSGPAVSWAEHTSVGDEIEIGGPRGSALAPAVAVDGAGEGQPGVDSAILIADESALPAAARWLEAFGADLPVTALFSVANPETAAYLAGHEGQNRRLSWFSGDDRDARLAGILRETPIGDGTFIFLAGEAGALVPLRRYLRRELELPKDQVVATGYWKRGVVALDHHAPIDPSDPD